MTPHEQEHARLAVVRQRRAARDQARAAVLQDAAPVPELTEVALSSCAYGCKVYRCGHGSTMVIHSVTYGHRQGSVQRSVSGTRCTCAR